MSVDLMTSRHQYTSQRQCTSTTSMLALVWNECDYRVQCLQARGDFADRASNDITGHAGSKDELRMVSPMLLPWAREGRPVSDGGVWLRPCAPLVATGNKKKTRLLPPQPNNQDHLRGFARMTAASVWSSMKQHISLCQGQEKARRTLRDVVILEIIRT